MSSISRRETLASVATVCAAPATVLAGSATPASEPAPTRLRAVWKWIEATKEWVRVRMDTLKPGDTASVEAEIGSPKRYVGVVKDYPRFAEDGTCEMYLTKGYIVDISKPEQSNQ